VSVRRTLLLALVVLALVPAVALAGSVNVSGKGSAAYTARGTATAFSTQLLPGTRIVATALPVASVQPTVTVNCLARRQRRCARLDVVTGAWIVSKPVTMLVEGADFRVTIRSPRLFQLGITGIGVLRLKGRGTYTTAGVDTPYDGPTVVKLRR
jgi:hypothetical protein